MDFVDSHFNKKCNLNRHLTNKQERRKGVTNHVKKSNVQYLLALKMVLLVIVFIIIMLRNEGNIDKKLGTLLSMLASQNVVGGGMTKSVRDNKTL